MLPLTVQVGYYVHDVHYSLLITYYLMFVPRFGYKHSSSRKLKKSSFKFPYLKFGILRKTLTVYFLTLFDLLFKVYKQDVIDLCTRRHGQSSRHGSASSPRSESRSSQSSDKSVLEPWRALLLLIPVRLGGEVLNPVYTPAIQTILANDMCLGIIGGKPKHSVFFVGFQGKCAENNSRRMVKCCVLQFALIIETDVIMTLIN